MSRIRLAAAQLRRRRPPAPSSPVSDGGPSSSAVGAGSSFRAAAPTLSDAAAVSSAADFPIRALWAGQFAARGGRRCLHSDSRAFPARVAFEDVRCDARSDDAEVCSEAGEADQTAPSLEDEGDEFEDELPDLSTREFTAEERSIASPELEFKLEAREDDGDPLREAVGRFDEEATLDTSEAEEGCVSSLATESCEEKTPPSGESPKEEEEPHRGRPHLHALSVDEVYEILLKARAKDVNVLDVGSRCEWADRLVLATGRSYRHLRGMAEALVYKVKKNSANVGPNSFPTIEGGDGEWVAVDCGGIVIHLFLEEARIRYDLEELWSRDPRLVTL